MKKQKSRVVMVRSTAGVFYGNLQAYKAKEATLTKVRRCWYWTGAASLSQLAEEGTNRPKDCKFPCEVGRIVIPDVMEMLDVTAKAKKTLDAVPVWSA